MKGKPGRKTRIEEYARLFRGRGFTRAYIAKWMVISPGTITNYESQLRRAEEGPEECP